MKTFTSIKSAALAVPAAAFMLGSSQAGTSVGINFQGSASGVSGMAVTATAFGIEASDWFSAAAAASGSLTPTPSSGGSFDVSWFAAGVWTSWAIPAYFPSDYVGYPGDADAYWGNLYGGYQVDLSGLAAQFPNGYVLQAIAATDGGSPQIAPISVTDGVTPETLTYTVRGTFTWNAAAGFSISTPTTNLFTSDTLTINGPADVPSGPRSFLAGLIITDKPVVTVPPQGAALASGGTITMNAGAVGVAPLSYQWRKGGDPISGATSVTYTKSGSTVGDSGNYDVVVTNLYGSATSPVATVTVAAPATVTWDADTGTSGAQDGDGTWTSANWWDGASDIAWDNFNFVTFGAGGTGNYTVTLPSAVIAGNLTFNANYTVSGSGSITLDSPTIAANSNATLNVPLLGTSGLTKSGAGTLALSGANIFSGGLTVNDGKVVAANGAVPATGAVTVNTGGTLSLTDAAYANVPGTLNIIGGTVSMDGATQNAHNYTGKTLTMQGGTLTSVNGPAGPANDGGYGNFILNNSTLVASGSAQSVISCTTLQAVNGGSFTVNDAVAGAGTDLLVSANISAGALVKTGLGTMELTAANTYTGNTTVTEGTLKLGAGSSFDSSPPLTLAAGATLDVSATAGLTLGSTKTLTGGGTVLGAVTADGGMITPTGSLSIGTLDLASTATLNIAPGAASLTITDTNGINTGTTGNVVYVDVGTDPITSGTYQLLQYQGVIQGDDGFNAFFLGTTPGGDYTYDLVQNANSIDLVVAPLAKLWTGALNSEWRTGSMSSPKNWKAGLNESDFVTGDDVLFDDSTDSTTVSINTANVSPNSVLFSNITKAYTLQGAWGITGTASLTKEGSGNLIINNRNSFTGAVYISGGTLTAASVADGGFDSALGAGIEIALGGGTLAYAGATSGTDRTLYLDADGTVEVTTPGTILTLSGEVIGSNSFTKTGAGTLAPTFDNTYYGPTRINAGILSIATLPDGGLASPLGQSSNAAANLVLGGGT
ncbi:MAG: autotransporter-associated beta strand repeat-containing protein, partial [Akkermansiaceae bacterium]|nr:autotransporter-associated beta strand repeat-containing protein [Akkermansiaceae bacterium]